MKITPIGLGKAALIKLVPFEDERGFFARSFCKKEFMDAGLNFDVAQCNVSYNHLKGTLRGMHYNKIPFQEGKIVSCISGAIYDVLLDANPESPSFGQWFGYELTAQNRCMLYIPPGFAHGYQTLVDHSTVSYMVDVPYTPSAETGLRWNDPYFGIQWPIQDGLILSKKDTLWPLYSEGGEKR